MTSSTLISSFGSSIAGFDVILLGLFLLGSALYGLSLGRVRIVGIIVATYIAFTIAVYAPFLSALASSMHVIDAYAKIAVFFVFFVLIFVQFFRRSLFSALGGSSRWWQTSTLSVLQVGLVISLVLTLLPPEMALGLSGLTKTVFLSDIGRGTWLILPLVGILFLPNG